MAFDDSEISKAAEKARTRAFYKWSLDITKTRTDRRMREMEQDIADLQGTARFKGLITERDALKKAGPPQ